MDAPHNVIKRGFRSRIYSTHATKDLCKLMLEDSGKIQEEDIRYVNKINRRLGIPMREPLYTKSEASRAAKRRFQTLSYNQKAQCAKNASVTFHDAGHILGSSIVVLDLKDGDRNIRLGYAVDLGRANLPMLNDPVLPKDLDYLIIESTYGGRSHSPIADANDKLLEAITRTVERKGKIIIPAFTLERTQEVIYILNQLYNEKRLPAVPIYVDSPLASEITEVFKYHYAYMNATTRNAIDAGNSPFDLPNLHFIREQRDSKALNSDKRPMIIISASGMCESGRVLHHLKNNIEDSRNMIVVVGDMAKDTLGRRIVEQSRFVRIYGVEYELNAEVVVINAFSGHADRNDLFSFVSSCLPLKRVFLVHGDEEQTWALFDMLYQQEINAYMPHKEETVEL